MHKCRHTHMHMHTRTHTCTCTLISRHLKTALVKEAAYFHGVLHMSHSPISIICHCNDLLSASLSLAYTIYFVFYIFIYIQKLFFFWLFGLTFYLCSFSCTHTVHTLTDKAIYRPWCSFSFDVTQSQRKSFIALSSSVPPLHTSVVLNLYI